MKWILILSVLVSFMAVYGRVCPKSYCKTQAKKCSITSPNDCSPTEVYRENSTLCGCCPACKIVLDEGVECFRLTGGVAGALRNAAGAAAECRDPLRCLKNICAKDNE